MQDAKTHRKTTGSLIVAIDGPAGSGKSTVTHLLAKRLGYTHIDTGALYRAIALAAAENQVSVDDGERLGVLARSAKLHFQWLEDRNHIFLNDRNVSNLIRTPEISMAASTISAHAQVRDALLGIQRQMAERGGAVLEGRDIGTVVFPDAEVKIFLNASIEARTERRRVELESKGIFLSFDEVKQQVIDRDKQDSERKVAPLKKAVDAIEIDSTKLSIEQVVESLYRIVRSVEAGLRGQLV